MTTKTLRYLLSRIPKAPCSKANEIYRTVLETAIARHEYNLYEPEIRLLIRRFGDGSSPAEDPAGSQTTTG